jgi:hypothetical protein
MAVNVNTVYRTVLLILNKEQRGYLTPDEFNRTAAQVQLEIFNEYFEDLNQQLRVPGNDSEYSDRIKNLEQRIAIFQDSAPCNYAGGVFTLNIPTSIPPVPQPELYKIGTVIYKDEKEIQYVQPNELLELNLSPITKPSMYWPVYTLRGVDINKNPIIKVYPTSIDSSISCTYLRKPFDPRWGFTTTAPNYQYVYNPAQYDPTTEPTGSQNFDLHPTEQTNLIIKILLYSGVIIKDQQIVQAAAQQIQNETINSKN